MFYKRNHPRCILSNWLKTWSVRDSIPVPCLKLRSWYWVELFQITVQMSLPKGSLGEMCPSDSSKIVYLEGRWQFEWMSWYLIPNCTLFHSEKSITRQNYNSYTFFTKRYNCTKISKWVWRICFCSVRGRKI